MQLDELRLRLDQAGFTVSQRDDVDEHAAAWFTGFTVGTLRNRRSKGLQPAYVRLGCGIRYPLAGLVEWLQAKVRNRAA